jgi:surfeit locus 1 family protein
MAASAGKRAVAPALALLVLAALFAGLGVWQVQRLGWKTRLIAQTDAAVHAAPIAVDALPPGDLSRLRYRRLAMTGHFVPAGTTLVTGTSTLGAGYWELVPMVDDGGRTIMINRGFLPEGSRIGAARAGVPAGSVQVEGLLRLTEPGGTWLRANRPMQDRWYSRDIAAIAGRHGVRSDPRLFIDSAGETPTPPGDAPVPGLTVIAFPNNHLGYALTWFTLGVMATGGAVMLLRRK